jgi:hypothetical protein
MTPLCSRAKSGAFRRRCSAPAGSSNMLTFALSGTLGCVRATAPDELTLAIASPLERPGASCRMVWIICVARDQALRAASALCTGDHIRVEGHIEPRRRKVGKLVFHSVAFIAETIERTSAISDNGGAGG